MNGRADYRRILQTQVPRVLGLQDRNRESSSWGCMDRNYWHYKTITEYPSATFQQPVLAMALLYGTAARGNCFFKSEELRESAISAMLYWTKIQHRDGSVDEFFLNEHSFCPTAFTSYAVSEALLLMQDELSQKEMDPIIGGLSCAGDWLIKHDNRKVANQMAAALNGLYNIWLLTGLSKYRDGGLIKLASLLGSQDREGWFAEYRGADLGYSFKMLDLLGHYWLKTDDRDVRNSLERLLNFVEPFVHPDGTTGGFYGSRNSSHLFPYGLEILANAGFREACRIKNTFLRGLRAGTALTPLHIDDKYLAYFYINSYAQAFVKGSTSLESAYARSKENCVIHRNGGIFSVKCGTFLMVGSAFKGGCFKVYVQEALLCQDAGYFATTSTGWKCSSQGWNPRSQWKIRNHGNQIEIELECAFVYFDNSLPLVRYMVLFKIFTKTVLRSGWIAQKFQKFVKRRKIEIPRKVDFTLHRQIRMQPTRVLICDEIRRQGSDQLSSISPSEDSTATHSASTRYVSFSSPSAPCSARDTATWVERLNEYGSVRLERELCIDSEPSPIRLVSEE